MTSREQILVALKCKLHEGTKTQFSDIILFGSQTKGKVNPDSDYDILIIPKSKLDWKHRREIGDICAEISIEYDILIDYKIISETEITLEPIGSHPLIIEALKNGIHA